MTEPSARKPVLVGANPGMQLYDGDTLTAYVATWRVDWSSYGSGTAVVLWRDDTVHVYGENVELATWLEHDFVRHFPEAEGLVWPEPVITQQAVHVDSDLATGLRAHSDDLEIRSWGVLDRRTFTTDDFTLGGVDHSLSLVLGPCSHATLSHLGHRVPGEPQIGGTHERPSSSAYLAEAEVWRR